MKIKKILDKKEELNINGQHCWNDCKVWEGYSAETKYGSEKLLRDLTGECCKIERTAKKSIWH